MTWTETEIARSVPGKRRILKMLVQCSRILSAQTGPGRSGSAAHDVSAGRMFFLVCAKCRQIWVKDSVQSMQLFSRRDVSSST